MPITEYKIVN